MEVALVSVVTGALKPVLGKLATLLGDEYKHFKSERRAVRSLTDELTTMDTFLQKMSDEEGGLDEQDKVWMNDVRELSYNMEHSIDDFMKHLTHKDAKPYGFMTKINHSLGKLWKMKAPRDLSNEIKDLEKQIIEVGERNERYKNARCKIGRAFRNTKNAKNDLRATIDNRCLAIFNHASNLVGIDKPKAEIIKMLTEEDGVASKQPQQTKMVSIVGSGGMGKTTLAYQVYQDLEGEFQCHAFVTVSRNPDMMKILRSILYLVAYEAYADTKAETIEQLLYTISDVLVDKRYLIVIDDIWNENLWETIKHAFPISNNLGNRIVTTTRVVSVSKECCSHANDSIYQMEPLSDDDSKQLFYARIFGSVSTCPHEFEQVSSDILKKCGGVPVAIITMASALAGVPQMKTKDEWHTLLKSIGRGYGEGSSMHDMRKILSLSYYDLPPHLKTCLLYLSTFPATCTIEKDRLVKKLIAEGIVTEGTELIGSPNVKDAKLRREVSIEEVASQYLDELVNRNVIHPLECNNNGEVITYHIHPMMHDALKAIAIEERFAAVLDDNGISSAPRLNLRHLSIDCQDSENQIDLSSMAFDGVHSLTVFGHANRFLLKHFQGTRVLDLEGCKSIERADLEFICSMVLLKRLCLAKTQISELPPQIGNLQYLEGLDVGGTQITHLPTQIGKLQHLKTLDARKSRVKDLPDQVVELRRLVHLLIGDDESCEGVKLPDGIGKMTSLQQLCTIDLRKCSASSLKELRDLPYLKYIAVVSSDELKDTGINDALFSALDKSIELRSLVVYSDFRVSRLHSYSAYKYLKCRKKLTVVRSLMVPLGFTGQHFLGMLDIRVCKLEEDDLKILRELPRLRSLTVRFEALPKKLIRISCEGFAQLQSFYIDCRMPRVVFEEGAMPKLEHLELKLYGGSASEEHMGIMHLLNLQKVTLRYSKWYATNTGIRETTYAMKTQAREQKNKFTLFIAEEDKYGKVTKKTEIFHENKNASSSSMDEIEEDEKQDEGFKIYDVVANPAAMKNIDPHFVALDTRGEDLVGIDGRKDQELMKLLSDGDNVPNKKLKTVSVVGFGGLGKTTLVKTVYDKIKEDFDCYAFVVAVPDLEKVFRDIISQLTMNSSYRSTCIQKELLNLWEILENRRYLIVIDDIQKDNQWEHIKQAFRVSNNLGSRIITTTRIVSVSKACCSYANGSIYQMEPLSDDDSKKLLYARIFGSVSTSPHEFEQVSSGILKKCGGVPAFIIAIASVLAGDPQMKTKDEWHASLMSIGRGHEKNIKWKDMQRILSLSYNDLPPHLMICLLYLCTFPSGHPIETDRLVKKLIAEGIVTQGTKWIGSSNVKDANMCRELSIEEAARLYLAELGKAKLYPELSTEEAARQYLAELVNRNVIHPLECNNNGAVITYHIHPMMHDALKAIAIEERFAASLNEKDISRPDCTNFGHLSIDSPYSENPFDISSMGFDGGVHSLTIFGHANRFLLRHFEDIRCLDLEGCKSVVRADVKYICSMVLLKQLCLAKTDITELPTQIGNLQHLEGLDVGGTQITKLPPQIGKLKRLRRLDVGGTQITKLPPQIGKLKRLRTLDARKSQVKDLPHQVVRLRRLVQLFIGDNESCEGVKVPNRIGKMTSLQQLCTIDLRKCSASSLKELGKLPYLREIAVVSSDEPEGTRMTNALLSSLDKSTKLRSLVVYNDHRTNASTSRRNLQ